MFSTSTFTQCRVIIICAGPEVVDQAVRVLEVVSAASPDVELKLESHLFGGCAIDAVGDPLPPSTLKACQEADAILMGISIPCICAHKFSAKFPRRFYRWPTMGGQCQSSTRVRTAEASKNPWTLCQYPSCKPCLRFSARLLTFAPRNSERRRSNRRPGTYWWRLLWYPQRARRRTRRRYCVGYHHLQCP